MNDIYAITAAPIALHGLDPSACYRVTSWDSSGLLLAGQDISQSTALVCGMALLSTGVGAEHTEGSPWIAVIQYKLVQGASCSCLSPATPHGGSNSAVASTSKATDWLMAGGATYDAACSDGPCPPCCGEVANIRSGGQHTMTAATVAQPLVGRAGDGCDTITRIRFGFRYLSGFFGGAPSNFSLSLISSISDGLDAPRSAPKFSLWQSPPLGDYPYEPSLGGCHNSSACYSPRVDVDIGALNVSNRAPLWLRLEFENRDKNLEIDIEDLSLEVFWGGSM